MEDWVWGGAERGSHPGDDGRQGQGAVAPAGSPDGPRGDFLQRIGGDAVSAEEGKSGDAGENDIDNDEASPLKMSLCVDAGGGSGNGGGGGGGGRPITGFPAALHGSWPVSGGGGTSSSLWLSTPSPFPEFTPLPGMDAHTGDGSDDVGGDGGGGGGVGGGGGGSGDAGAGAGGDVTAGNAARSHLVLPSFVRRELHASRLQLIWSAATAAEAGVGGQGSSNENVETISPIDGDGGAAAAAIAAAAAVAVTTASAPGVGVRGPSWVHTDCPPPAAATRVPPHRHAPVLALAPPPPANDEPTREEQEEEAEEAGEEAEEKDDHPACAGTSLASVSGRVHPTNNRAGPAGGSESGRNNACRSSGGSGSCVTPGHAGLARARRTLRDRMNAERARWNRTNGAAMAAAASAVEEARNLPPGSAAERALAKAVRKKRQLCNQRSAAASRASQRGYIDALEWELQQL